jgi:hypothetical protein
LYKYIKLEINNLAGITNVSDDLVDIDDDNDGENKNEETEIFDYMMKEKN